MPNIKPIKKPTFLTSNAKNAFNYLRLAFIKAPIFYYLDLKNYIQITTDASGYSISEMLSQLKFSFNILLNNSNKSDFSQWHLVAYFSKKIIIIKT